MASDRRPLVLRPFRGLRFDPGAIGDLGTVVSPPYDVLDADTVRDLEAANRRNIVRLILSRQFERPYRAVRDRLHAWRDKGYLRADDVPALYVYQYAVDGTTVRGLIGLVGLRPEQERVVLPHEDVMPGPVEDRMVLMRTTETNLEPILLVHDGSDALRSIVDVTVGGEPLARFAALDGSQHCLWSITDPAELADVAAELTGGQALIADGHHRYAAYLRLQAALRDPAAADGTSPWDHGLAMLVDQSAHPLRIGPIHRSVRALTMSDVQDASAARGEAFLGMPDREAAFAALTTLGQHAGSSEPAGTRGQGVGSDGPAPGLDPSGPVTTFVVSDGRAWAVLVTPRTAAVDAAVLHDTLLPAWGVTDEQVGYHHSLDQALTTTSQQPGIVIAVQPPSVADVMASAALGIRMPRKSTSFAPKPRMGVVMRDLRDD